MLFHKSDKEKRIHSNPAWLRWIVVLFIGYTIFVNYTERQSNTVKPILGVAESDEASHAFARADFGAYILPGGIKVIGNVDGSGEEARCGQMVTLQYDEILPATATKKGETDQELTIHVGVHKEKQPWMLAVPGMKPDGVRQIQIPASMRYNTNEQQALGILPTDMIDYRVKMKEVMPASSPDHMVFQATDRVMGSGETASCDTVVDIHVVLWSFDGTKKFDSRTYMDGTPLTMHIGHAKYFYGLDRAVLNMRKYGQRSAIIPPAYATPTQTDEADNPFLDVLDGEQIAIIDITMLDVRWRE